MLNKCLSVQIIELKGSCFIKGILILRDPGWTHSRHHANYPLQLFRLRPWERLNWSCFTRPLTSLRSSWHSSWHSSWCSSWRKCPSPLLLQLLLVMLTYIFSCGNNDNTGWSLPQRRGTIFNHVAKFLKHKTLRHLSKLNTLALLTEEIEHVFILRLTTHEAPHFSLLMLLPSSGGRCRRSYDPASWCKMSWSRRWIHWLQLDSLLILSWTCTLHIWDKLWK